MFIMKNGTPWKIVSKHGETPFMKAILAHRDPLPRSREGNNTCPGEVHLANRPERDPNQGYFIAPAQSIYQRFCLLRLSGRAPITLLRYVF